MVTVLIIETERPLMRLMSWFLLEAEHRVTASTTMDDARKHAMEAAPRVIVFNTHMEPDEKRAAIADLRRIAPESRILDVREAPGVAADSGADSYLSAPFDSYDLLAAVQNLGE